MINPRLVKYLQNLYYTSLYSTLAFYVPSRAIVIVKQTFPAQVQRFGSRRRRYLVLSVPPKPARKQPPEENDVPF